MLNGELSTRNSTMLTFRKVSIVNGAHLMISYIKSISDMSCGCVCVRYTCICGSAPTYVILHTTKPNQYTKFVVWHNNIAVRHLYLVVVKSCSSASIFSSKIEVSVYRKRVKSEVWIVGDNSYKFFFYHDFLVIFSKESIEILLKKISPKTHISSKLNNKEF